MFRFSCKSVIALVIAATSLAACGEVLTVSPDANPPEVCIPESDTAFCARQAACEVHADLDNCGMQRQVDCGACAAGLGCVAGSCKAPVCSTFDYGSSALAALSRAAAEDSIGAATPDGQTIVILQTESPATCGSFHVMFADEVTPGSGTYMLYDATAALQALRLFTGQQGFAITADGLTLIARSTDGKRWSATARSARHQIDFAAASETQFAQLNAQLATTAGTFRAPVLSADGLELVYKVESSDLAERGIYSSVRESVSVPFPPGSKHPSPISDYEFPTGLSSDRLTLFVFESFSGRVFQRASTSGEFTNPNAPAPPPQLPGWSHTPLADCSKLIAMTSPGGCAAEDIVLLTRQ
jgi:hypothetical protein